MKVIEGIQVESCCGFTIQREEGPDGKIHKKRIHCGAYPTVIQTGGLFYARCPKCTKWDPYEFLGCTTKSALRVWNEGNTKFKGDEL